MRGLVAHRRSMREHRWTGGHVSAYVDGELAPHDRTRIEAHAELCPECRRALRELRRTLQGLMGLKATPTEGIADRVIDRLRRES